MPPTKESPMPSLHPSAVLVDRPPKPESEPIVVSEADLLLAQIRHVGRTLDDLEKLRIQHVLRRKAFEREHGFALPPDSVSDELGQAEGEALLELRRLWRKHPLAGWAKQIPGVGEKSIARLIAEIGDPADRKTVSQLWAYCGYDPNRKHRKGMTQEEALACGNPRAKTRCFLIAEKSVMQNGAADKNGRSRSRSPYRDLYEGRRQATTDRGWTDGHSHADGMRIVAKAFLRDLWIASRQATPVAQTIDAGGSSIGRPLHGRTEAQVENERGAQ